jgi:Protein of unknown function (DUF2934)
MNTASAPDPNANPHPLEIIRGPHAKQMSDEIQRRVAEKAYQLFQNGDHAPGHDVDHSLTAEKEVLKRVSEVRESGPWVIVNLEVLHAPADGVAILMDDSRAIIAIGEPQEARKRPLGGMLSYFCAEWPGKVAPETASAYVNDGVLTLEVKLTAPTA